MKGKIIGRGLIGFLAGISICYIITIIISLVFGDGAYYSVVPELKESCGSEIKAVILQALCGGLLGAMSAAGSVVWEMDQWSLLKQTMVHFVILTMAMLPIAYVTNWMEHTVIGVISYFGIFLVLYVGIWFSQYIMWKKKIQKLNDKISE